MDVIQFFKPYAFEKYSRSKQFIPMFQNYIKVAIRNIIKRKAFTLINMTGLTVGLAAIMLISLYVQHELAYDTSNPQHEDIFRLVRKYRDQTYNCIHFSDYYNTQAEVQLKLVNHLTAYDEVANACQFTPSHSAIGPNEQYYATIGEKQFVVENILYTNTHQALLEMFPQDFLMGNQEMVAENLNQIVFTVSQAERIFGSNWRQAIELGQQMMIREAPYQIAAVVQDPPSNVHYEFDFILHQDTIPSWGAYTYVQSKDGVSADQIVDKFTRQVETVFPGYNEDVLEKGFLPVPLAEIHFTQGSCLTKTKYAHVD